MRTLLWASLRQNSLEKLNPILVLGREKGNHCRTEHLTPDLCQQVCIRQSGAHAVGACVPDATGSEVERGRELSVKLGHTEKTDNSRRHTVSLMRPPYIIGMD